MEKSAPDYTSEKVPLEKLSAWFDERKQPKVEARGLQPVAFVATIWLADLLSNLINIVSAMWFSGAFRLPPVISGILCGFFVNGNGQPLVPDFVQALLLLVVQGGGMWGLWILVQRSTWPQWMRDGSSVFNSGEIPIWARPTRKGFALAVGFLIFWLSLTSTLGTTNKFLAGIDSGALNPAASLQHLWGLVLLLGLASYRKIVRGPRVDEATRIIITANDVDQLPLLMNLDETSRPGFPVLAKFDPDIQKGKLLPLYRPVNESGSYRIATNEEVDLTTNDVCVFNLTRWEERVTLWKTEANQRPEAIFDDGDDSLFVAKTKYIVDKHVRVDNPVEQGYFARPEWLRLCANMATLGSVVDCRFDSCRDNAIREFLEGGTMTVNELENAIYDIESRVASAGLVIVGGQMQRQLDGLKSMLEEIDKQSNEWKKRWDEFENKLKGGYDGIPPIFAAHLTKAKMLQTRSSNKTPTSVETSDSGLDAGYIPDEELTVIAHYLSVRIHVSKCETRKGRSSELVQKLSEIKGGLSSKVDSVNKDLQDHARAEKEKERLEKEEEKRKWHEKELAVIGLLNTPIGIRLAPTLVPRVLDHGAHRILTSPESDQHTIVEVSSDTSPPETAKDAALD